MFVMLMVRFFKIVAVDRSRSATIRREIWSQLDKPLQIHYALARSSFSQMLIGKAPPERRSAGLQSALRLITTTSANALSRLQAGAPEFADS
jgi:hypothetical protein